MAGLSGWRRRCAGHFWPACTQGRLGPTRGPVHRAHDGDRLSGIARLDRLRTLQQRLLMKIRSTSARRAP